MLRFRPTLTAAVLIGTATLLAPMAMAQSSATPPATSATPTPPAAPIPASAPAVVPRGLVGAWGADSSCTGDVAIFRADGTVLNPAAPANTPPLSFTVTGDSITLTEGQQSGTFAFALSDQAVAWSNGSSMVLKERCADQTPFAAGLSAAGTVPGHAVTIPAGPLPDQLRALAGQPVPYQGNTVQIQAVSSTTPKTALYTDISALPDSHSIPGDARLFYRIFPTPAAAAAYVSLAADNRASFLREKRGAGFFSTASAVDEGPQSSKTAPVSISCLRFHSRRVGDVAVSCFAQMPNTRLVAGAERHFASAAGAKAKDMGPTDNLTQTLALTGVAIGQLRGFLATHPQN